MHFRKRTSFSSAARLLPVRSSLSSLRFLLPPHRLPSQKADYNFPAAYLRRRGAFDTRFSFVNDFLGPLEFSFSPISEIAAFVAESLLLLLFFFFFSFVDRLCCRFAALLFT
jgi:hypothetical protein